MGEWQPIEMAPKDGTRILVWAPDSCFETPFIVHWFEDDLDPEDSWWFEREDNTGLPLDVEPTHWMPLPEPPK